MKIKVIAYNENTDTFLIKNDQEVITEIDAVELQLSDYINADEPIDLVGRTFKVGLFIEAVKRLSI